MLVDSAWIGGTVVAAFALVRFAANMRAHVIFKVVSIAEGLRAVGASVRFLWCVWALTGEGPTSRWGRGRSLRARTVCCNNIIVSATSITGWATCIGCGFFWLDWQQG